MEERSTDDREGRSEEMSVRDTRMIARAVVERWPIKKEYRDAIVKRLMQIVADPSSSPREATAAAKALMAAERQNQEDQITDATDDHRNRFFAIAERLGVGGNPRRVPDSRTGNDLRGTDERVDYGGQG